MIGTKGIPAATAQGGGIETHVEELAQRFVERHHRVTVYVRPYANPERRSRYRGIRLITLPTIRRKHVEAIVHTFFATMHVLFQDVDIIHYHGVGPSTLAWIPRLFKPRAKVVVTFHSRDQFHEKWGWFARMYLAFGEWTSVRFPHATIATSHVIQVFCRRMYGGKKVQYIPNGVEVPSTVPGHETLRSLGLSSGGYFFTLSRLVPHKAVEDAIHAFMRLKTDKQLVVIGSATYDDVRYEEALHRLAAADPRIIFAGHLQGEPLRELIAHGYAMIHASRSEGLSVAVLEAMAYARLVIMSDIPENLELIDHSGLAYHVGDVDALRESMQIALEDPMMVKARGERARGVVGVRYSWESVVVRTEYLYRSL